ncbi:MAG: PilZ domain-containing protein [Phycisphaeraceae bacterium]|nr:PilZ domain-containing protein [Phycisphaeraceae bacterium]
MLSNNINHFDKAFAQTQQEESRKGGRFPTMSVYSSLGEVLDLSSGGALLVKRRWRRVPTAEAFVVEIKYAEIKVAIRSRLVREAKKKGIGHLLAIEFMDMTEQQLELIRDIVRNSRSWRLFEFSEPEAA